MKSFQEFMGEESNFKQRDKVLSKHSDRLKKLAKRLHKGDVKGDVNEDKREEKARRSELAKKHGIKRHQKRSLYSYKRLEMLFVMLLKLDQRWKNFYLKH